MNAIETSHLSRAFGRGRSTVTVVDDLNLTVPAGIVFGYLGPNGAGKTTTIRLLIGVLAPTSGHGRVAGLDLKDADGIKARIGYANQGASVYRDLTVRENLMFKASLYLAPGAAETAVQKVLDTLELNDKRGQLAGELSGGWRQRLSIGTAVVHGPSLAFLDEPTAGLDPSARRSLWDAIYALCGQGTTIFVTTHYMDEAERCHRLAMIANGRVLAEGTPEALKTNLGGAYYELETPDLAAALGAARAMPGVADAWITGSSLRLAAREPLPEGTLQRLPAPPRRVLPTLEDVFVALSAPVAGGRA
ncbi:MAG TPA: ABC transporter ATP-binding protein [Deinococcales bacterium]|nr:ABC transporter ATP-binding protein [Deinococcales bacterium]